MNWEENGEKCEREVNGESVKVLPDKRSHFGQNKYEVWRFLIKTALYLAK